MQEYRVSDDQGFHTPHPGLPEKAARALRLNGNVSSVEPLQLGMSGSNILRVTTDQDTLVMKYSHDDPRKVANEIKRHRLLQDTPLAPHLLHPLFASEADGIVVYPYYPGIQVREGIKTGTLPEAVTQAQLKELLQIKRSWWSTQPKEAPEDEYVSMQREEWQETKQDTRRSAQQLEELHSLPKNSLWERPIAFQGTMYRPLQETVEEVDSFLSERPPYTVVAHNDATGANILLHPDEQAWRLIDPEWTGPSDPAEAYIRMIKYVTSATARTVDNASLTVENNTVAADYSVQFPSTAIALQNTGLSQRQTFSEDLHDPDFMRRSAYYLSGSYLRELALIKKRQTPELGVFTIIKAAEALDLKN